jgi:hypothetical protein
MVSSVFGQTAGQLVKKLKEVAAANAFDPEYMALREGLPADFPV